MGGVRNLRVENDLSINGVAGEVSQNTNITNAMIYILPNFAMFSSKIKGLSFNLVLGIGAGDSDLVYEVFPQFFYQFTDIFLASVGYRLTGWEYQGESGASDLNLNMGGFVLGIGARF